MAKVSHYAQLFKEDLKTSWYFRIWFVTWFICAIFVLVAMIINGARSDRAAKHEKWSFWIEHAKSIEYPNFALRTASDEKSNQIGYAFCSLNGLIINTAACPDGKPRTQCVSFNMAGDYATREKNNLICMLQLNVTTDPDKMIGFEILKPANEYGIAFTWIRPTANAWVLLTKSVVVDEKGGKKDSWGRQLIYHSSAHSNTTFQIDIRMDTFSVFHWVEQDNYTGWMAVGDVGGFAFFLLILHTMVMWIVAIFIENNSRWLSSDLDRSAAPEYQDIK